MKGFNKYKEFFFLVVSEIKIETLKFFLDKRVVGVAVKDIRLLFLSK